MPKVAKELSVVLAQLNRGDESARDELLLLVYQELRRIAGHYLTGSSREQTLQRTALVHEAYLKLFGSSRRPVWNDSQHFIRSVARAMRHVVVEYARRKAALKRPTDNDKVALQDVEYALSRNRPLEILRLNDALGDLEVLDPRQAHVVEALYFGGLTVEEAASELNISASTVKREWRLARSWLALQLKDTNKNDT